VNHAFSVKDAVRGASRPHEQLHRVVDAIDTATEVVLAPLLGCDVVTLHWVLLVVVHAGTATHEVFGRATISSARSAIDIVRVRQPERLRGGSKPKLLL
jgi:hypothetical protein